MVLVKQKTPGSESPGGPEVVGRDALLAALESDTASDRRSAARELAAFPETAPALCDRLAVEQSPSVRAAILMSLIRIGSPEAAGRLAEFLRSDDATLRNGAMEALQEMPDALEGHVDRLLADGDSDVRIFAVNILSAVRLRSAPAWLARVIRSDSHVNVCAAAVDGLAEIGGVEMLDDLADLRRRFAGDDFMEFAIDTASLRIRGR
ncbi:MAG: HEAT repeat domain-containing protein [Telmatospirillum sp.]|nr:HEAT repeat domain-containing protein [Telmatospirillum sp.]